MSQLRLLSAIKDRFQANGTANYIHMRDVHQIGMLTNVCHVTMFYDAILYYSVKSKISSNNALIRYI